MYKCERCGKEVFEKFGSGRFCSRACANARDNSGPKSNRMKKICVYCGKITRNEQYCSRECYLSAKQGERLGFIAEWLKGNMDIVTIQEGTMEGELKPSSKRAIKEFLYTEQNGRCSICGCSDIHNGKPLVFILDHIDGNWRNNTRENFRLICPNCNSQLDTTKRNYGRGRLSWKYFYRQRKEKLDS